MIYHPTLHFTKEQKKEFNTREKRNAEIKRRIDMGNLKVLPKLISDAEKDGINKSVINQMKTHLQSLKNKYSFN